MKKLVLVLCFLLGGCAQQLSYTKFYMTQPQPSPIMSYQDESIAIQFSMDQASWIRGVDGMKQYIQFTGLAFNLQNKTDEVITVDWNKMSFIDPTGSSGNAVMHQGIKYNECTSSKISSSVPPNGRISDVIVPCYAVEWKHSSWNVSMLPSPYRVPTTTFGLFMPLQVGSETKNYTFMFEASVPQQ